jgi:hypothetical protein
VTARRKRVGAVLFNSGLRWHGFVVSDDSFTQSPNRSHHDNARRPVNARPCTRFTIVAARSGLDAGSIEGPEVNQAPADRRESLGYRGNRRLHPDFGFGRFHPTARICRGRRRLRGSRVVRTEGETAIPTVALEDRSRALYATGGAMHLRGAFRVCCCTHTRAHPIPNDPAERGAVSDRSYRRVPLITHTTSAD